MKIKYSAYYYKPTTEEEKTKHIRKYILFGQ